MKNSIESKKLKPKELKVIILTAIMLVILTCVLLTQMKNSHPFNTNQNYVLVEDINTSISNAKTTNHNNSIIFAVLSLMTLITIKLRKALKQI